MPEITLLGTGGMLPLPNRWLTSCYLENNGKSILIDCGEGTQIAITAAGRSITRVDMLLITHMHADHVSGIPGFLLSLGNGSRTQPLDIYLPEGKSGMIKNLLCICDRLPYELRLHELPLKRACEFTADMIDPLLKITSMPMRHSCDCLGYSLTFGRKLVFQPDKAKALEIPLQYWKLLHAGETVTLDDGRVITPEQVTENTRKPIKVTYVTDTLPTNRIAELAHDSDLFICEGMYGDEDKKDSMNKKGHMLMQDACLLAKKAGAKRLWLTHYSPAECYPKRHEDKLKSIFENVTISRDGEYITL